MEEGLEETLTLHRLCVGRGLSRTIGGIICFSTGRVTGSLQSGRARSYCSAHPDYPHTTNDDTS